MQTQMVVLLPVGFQSTQGDCDGYIHSVQNWVKGSAKAQSLHGKNMNVDAPLTVYCTCCPSLAIASLQCLGLCGFAFKLCSMTLGFGKQPLQKV